MDFHFLKKYALYHLFLSAIKRDTTARITVLSSKIRHDRNSCSFENVLMPLMPDIGVNRKSIDTDENFSLKKALIIIIIIVAENIAGSFFKSDDRIHIIIENEAAENI